MESPPKKMQKEALNSNGRKAIAGPYVFIVFQALIFFAGAGTLDIPRGWLFYGISVAYFTAANIAMAIFNPEILNERGKMHTGTKSWDTIFFILCTPFAHIFLHLTAGFDLGRLDTVRFPVIWSASGCVMYVLAGLLRQWAAHSNRHFEVTVRIQKDRAHGVVTTGPYRFVRHPGYVGMISMYLLMPVITGSILAMIPAIVIAGLFVARTALEDRTLQNELASYKEYAAKVRYRLIPFIW